MNLRQFFKLFLLTSLVFCLVACSRAQLPVQPSGTQLELSQQLPCRPVHHALGETCVPLQPQRIATLSDVDFVNVLALGMRPIATVFYTTPNDVPAYLKGKLDRVQILGTNAQPSLERMLQIKPDLVLGVEQSIEPLSSLLSRIAPTVAGSWQGTSSWRDYFNFVAEVLDKKTEAQAVWTGYYQRIRELQTALRMDATVPEAQHSPLKISVFHICCGSLHVDVKNSFNGSILADVGFLRPSAQDVVVEGGLKFISEEMIPEVDADVIFIPTDARDRESNRRLDYIKQSPLWQRLEAVRQNRVYLVDYHTWRSANPFAADGVIDDLFKYLVSSSIDTTK